MIEEMVQALVDPRYLVLKELSRWKCAGREELLFPNTGEIIIFIGYFKLGFKVPLHWFMQDLSPVLRGPGSQSQSQRGLIFVYVHLLL